MTIIDLDKIVEDKGSQFVLNGKEHEIKPVTYGQMIELGKLEKQIESEMEDTEKILMLQADYINMMVPTLTRDILMDTANTQVKRILEELQNVLSGMESDDEVAFYRKKYKDEYRKNSERVEEKSE